MKIAMALLLSLLLTVSLAGCKNGIGNSSSGGNEMSSSNGLIPEDGWNEIPSDTTESNTSSEIQSAEIGSVASTVSKRINATSSSEKAETQTSSDTTSLNQEQTKPGTLKEVYKPTFAKDFQIEYYYGGAKIISTSFSTTSEEGVTNVRKQRILILPQGAVQPIDVKWDKKIDGAVTRVVTLASAHAGHFANLNAIDSIKGTSLSPTSCEIPELKKALEVVNAGAAPSETTPAQTQTTEPTTGKDAETTEPVENKDGESTTPTEGSETSESAEGQTDETAKPAEGEE